LALFLEDHAARVYPTAEDHAFARSFLGDISRPVIAIHPGSGSPRKNWPAENWQALGTWLTRHASHPRLLLIGGEADSAPLAALTDAWQRADVLVARDLALPRLAAVLRCCRLFLGHDTGISHLAAAVETPCVLLFGPTDPAVWAPANPQVSVVPAADGDLASLPLSTVQEAVSIRLAL
jgi:heptosyltransferase-2